MYKKDKYTKYALHNNEISGNYFYQAATNGHFELVKWLISINKNVVKSNEFIHILCRVCEYGFNDILKYFLDNFECDIYALDNYCIRWALQNGHIETVEILYNYDNDLFAEMDLEEIFYTCASTGQLEMMIYLYTTHNINLYSFDSNIIEDVIVSGHLDVLLWLFENMVWVIDQLNEDIWYRLCPKINSYEVMLWLTSIIDIDINILKKAFTNACSNGNFEIAKLLYNDHFHLPSAFLCASVGGHLDIMKWLYDLDQKVLIEDHATTSLLYASELGNINIIRWLIETGVDVNWNLYDDYAFRISCEKGYYHIAELLLEINNDIDICARKNYAFMKACKNNHIHIAKLLCKLNSNYHIKIIGDRVVEYKINYLFYKALDAFNENNYDAAIDMLQIPTINNCVPKYDKCSICFEKINKLIILKCGHVYCLECILHWFTSNNVTYKQKCAICRNKFTIKDVTHHCLPLQDTDMEDTNTQKTD
jgi:ankyrin repeat protein